MPSINGFEIEDFNVHGIKEGAKTSICPKCSHTRKKKTDKCMSVFWDTGLGQCNHCGSKIQLHTYKKSNIDRSYKKPLPKTEIVRSDKVNQYFEGRGISKDTLDELKVTSGNSWMPKAQKEIPVIEFNYFFRDELINTKSRGAKKDFKFEKDCEQLIYNLDAVNGESSCVFVEGEVDALSFCESGIKNVCSVPNGFTLPRADGTSTIQTGYLDSYYDIFDRMDKIYLAFDNDTAGIEGQKEFIRRFGSEKIYLVDLKDCKDANDFLLKYSKEELANTIATAIQIPIDEITTISDQWSDLENFYKNGAPKGATIDLEGFDEVASFEMGQYTLLVSAPGSGKSDFIDHVVAKLAIKYGYKTGICSTENTPVFFHYDKIIKKILGYRPAADQLNSDSVQKVKHFIQDHYIHHEKENRYYLQDVLKKFSELVKRKGCRIFILDPFNKIKLKGVQRSNVNEYTEEYHMLIDEFCKKHDAHIFLVLHPNKLGKKKLGKDTYSEKTYMMPSAYDAKGGGEHFDMSYNILGLVRDYDREVVHIRTLKWKFQHLGTAGVDLFYKWNINNGRYTPIDGYFDDSSNFIPNSIWNNQSWLEEPKPIEPSEHKKELPLGNPKDVFDSLDDGLQF